MGFDPLTQRVMRNSIVEFGEISFTDDETTVEVPTRLNTVFLNIGVNITDNLTVKGDKAVTAGKVTFTRAGSGTSGATFQYFMAGF